MSSLPIGIYTAAQVRAVDRHAIQTLGIASYTLMTRAGAASLSALEACWPTARRVVIVCGPGNNGGDGYVMARLARARRFDVQLIALYDPDKLQGDARRAYDDFVAEGGIAVSWDDECLKGADVIVDAIFGTGLTRSVEPAMADKIDAMNAQRAPRFALDIPSGLHADTGHVMGAAVIAERTLSFIGPKLGFYLGEGPDHAGVVMNESLEIPPQALASIEPDALRIDDSVVHRLLPPRPRTSHKGRQGRVLILGGGVGMAGAARMAGEAALRVGAGLVTIATRTENVAAIVGARPELICHGVERVDDLQALIERCDVLAIGPGLGQDLWAQAMFNVALNSDKVRVIDADGLNLLAQSPRTSENGILTPHPGEAARLLGAPTSSIQADRLGSARAIAERFHGTVVLKGAGTVVLGGGRPPSICDRGNPGMATPGMGDVLTGVVAGVAAQAMQQPERSSTWLTDAACAGVLVHATAGDLAARRGQRGLIATDLFEHLRSCVNPA